MGSGPWEELCDHWLLLGGGERVVIVPILQMKKQKPTEAE